MEYLNRCRICLTTISSVKIKINVEIQREFQYLTSEELEGSEKYSNEICADCFVCLQNSCKFKAFCQENQKKLREKLMEIKRPQTQPNKKMDDPLPVDLDFIKTEPTLEITPVFVETHPEIKTEEADSDQERENLINYYLNMATSQKAEKPVKEKKPKTKTVQNKITKKPTTQSTRQDPSE
jgi:predicted metal-dependent hydrolase